MLLDLSAITSSDGLLVADDSVDRSRFSILTGHDRRSVTTIRPARSPGSRPPQQGVRHCNKDVAGTHDETSLLSLLYTEAMMNS